jgi:hypothetical protein
MYGSICTHFLLFLLIKYFFLIIQGAFTSQHFDHDLNFHVTDENLMLKKVC